MERISGSDEVGGAGGAYSYNALKRLDQLWSSICSAPIGRFCIISKLLNILKFIATFCFALFINLKISPLKMTDHLVQL